MSIPRLSVPTTAGPSGLRQSASRNGGSLEVAGSHSRFKPAAQDRGARVRLYSPSIRLARRHTCGSTRSAPWSIKRRDQQGSSGPLANYRPITAAAGHQHRSAWDEPPHLATRPACRLSTILCRPTRARPAKLSAARLGGLCPSGLSPTFGARVGRFRGCGWGRRSRRTAWGPGCGPR